jgi:hypothetical protein
LRRIQQKTQLLTGYMSKGAISGTKQQIQIPQKPLIILVRQSQKTPTMPGLTPGWQMHIS